MERERILEITEMGRKQFVLNGGKLGRKIGSMEDKIVFERKPQTKSIMKHLKMGKSNRDIIGRLNCSPKTITRVRKLIECYVKKEKRNSEEFTKRKSVRSIWRN